MAPGSASDRVFTNLPRGSRFDEVIDFYLFRTPCPGTSRLGKSFGELGWCGGKVNALQSLMRKESSLGDRWVCDRQMNLPRRLEEVKREGGAPFHEYAVYSKGGAVSSNTKTKALFYGIRCALAHGRFSVLEHEGDIWYELENSHNGQVRGRYLLKEATLLAWAETVERAPEITKKHRKTAKRKKR